MPASRCSGSGSAVVAGVPAAVRDDLFAETFVRPLQECVARVVGDLHEPSGEVEQHRQQTDARRQQPEDRVVRGQSGDPDDPDRADDGCGHRTHPPDDHHGNEAQRCVDHEEAPGAGEGDVGVGATQQGAAHPRQRSCDGEGTDLLPGRAHLVGGGSVLVVAHRHDRAAHPAVPEPAGDQQDHREDDQDHVVVGALTGEGEGEELAGHERQVGTVRGCATQDIQAEEVLLGRQGEDEGDHGQIETFDPQRAEPEDRGQHGGAGGGGGDGQPEGHSPLHQAGGEQCTQAGESHLAEGQLTQPSREHGQRRGADREGQHLGEGLLRWTVS